MRRTVKRVMVLAMVLFLVLTVACTPSEAELVKGILQNVDTVNGEITIVTKDGKTVTLKVATEASVETEEASSALETLEPGASVEAKVSKDRQVARSIKARQAEVEGTIVEIKGNEVTVESERGRKVTVLVTDRTRIELEDDLPGTLADLRVGADVEIKFDPGSRVAFKIAAEEEEAEIEGFVVEIKGNEVTIETERGRKLTLLVNEQTQIELEDDIPGTVADLQVGAKVEIKFDPSTRTAFKIEAEKEKEVGERETGQGTIEIRVTDPPPANVTSAVVYLTDIEVHRISDNVSEWVTIIGAPPSFDLMAVIGVEAILGSANVTAGKYTQIRIGVDRVEVVTAAGDNITAEVPSEKLKIVRPFTVEAGVTTVLTLDFDGEKSLVLPGKDVAAGKAKALFKPVIKLLIEKEGKGEKAETEEAEEQEFQGTVDNITGTIWLMTIRGKTMTVDVSGAEIEGEPAVGARAKVEGTVSDNNTIIASEAEIKKG